MPDLSHLWQRFLQALALLLGLAVGVAATVFGYSNTGTVSVGFSIWHLSGVPLWAVALVPLGVLLVLGTLYHWWSSFSHFTENIGHRRRVHDLEQEVGKLKEHLDRVLEMPDHGATPARAALVAKVAEPAEPVEAADLGHFEPSSPEPEALPAPAAAPGNGADKKPKRTALKKTEPVAVAAGVGEIPAAESTDDANSTA